MSLLTFPKSDILTNAEQVKKSILDGREQTAIKQWNELHKQGFWSKLFRQTPPPIPAVDPEWLKKQIENDILHGNQLDCAEDFLTYCRRTDSPDTIALSREDAHRLWLF